MRHFWRKPKEVHTKQRVIFIVREFDPLCFLDQHSEDKVSKTAESHLTYMTNNIGRLVSGGLIVNLSTEEAHMTTGAIRRKLDGKLTYLRPDAFPAPKGSNLKSWTKEVTELLADRENDSLIAVVDRSSFELWLDKTDLIGEESENTCILMCHGPTKITIAA